jgi:splicing factor 45
MARYGWKEGQGLGANESGMLNPLMAEAAEAPGTKGKGKKGKAAQAQASSSSSTSAFGAVGKGRGNITSELKSERQREERERFGEPSPVVLLTNMVGLDDVGDPDLPGEIGEDFLPDPFRLSLLPVVSFSFFLSLFRTIRRLISALFGYS